VKTTGVRNKNACTGRLVLEVMNYIATSVELEKYGIRTNFGKLGRK